MATAAANPMSEPLTGMTGAVTLTEAAPAPALIPGDMLYEVIDGKIVEVPSMGVYEALIATMLAVVLHQIGGSHPRGRVVTEALFRLDPSRSRKHRPDVAFVSFERWPRRRPVPRVEAWEVVPDLAVEVVSASNSADEVISKVEDYCQAGVRLVWVIYPSQRKVYAYRSPTEIRVLQPGDDLDGGETLPGFRLPVADLFEEAGEDESGAEPVTPSA